MFRLRKKAGVSCGAVGMMLMAGALMMSAQAMERQTVGLTATAKSIWGTINTPDKAIDGNLDTRWESSQNFPDPEYIFFTRPNTNTLTRMVITWETAAAATYQIFGTNSIIPPQVWTPISAVISKPTPGMGSNRIDELKTFNVAVGTNQLNESNYQYIKIEGLTKCYPQWGFSIREVALFEDFTPTVPCVIKAEQYDNGASFFDNDPANVGGKYRTDAVDIQNCWEGGYNVGWFQPGEWTAYTVTFPTPGSYTFTARVATGATNGAAKKISMYFDAAPQGDLTFNTLGNLNAGNDWGWQAWQNASATVNIIAPLTKKIYMWRQSSETADINLKTVTIAAVGVGTALNGTGTLTSATGINFSVANPGLAFGDKIYFDSDPTKIYTINEPNNSWQGFWYGVIPPAGGFPVNYTGAMHKL